MKIESLHIYPIKSAKGFEVDRIQVEKIGFKNDRFFAICDVNHKIITAREFPKLLGLQTIIKGDDLCITFNNNSKVVALTKELSTIELSLFKKSAFGKLVDTDVDIWLSNQLGFECKLVKIAPDHLRETNNHQIAFSDEYPIHLIAQETIDILSKASDIENNVTRFRPNIVVSGIKAFEEDKIDSLTIGKCEFKVVSTTQRCSLITIDPYSFEKDKNQEPLRTLAKEFGKNSKAELGVYLVPVKTGVIHKTDNLN